MQQKTQIPEHTGGPHFGKAEVLGSIVIGEAVTWLLFIMARVNAPNLDLPENLVATFTSLTTAIIAAAVLPVLSLAGLYVAYWLGKKLAFIYQAAKFSLVGALNTFIDFGVLNALILLTDKASGIPFVIFSSVSFTAAVANSYYWNKYWTFSDKTGNVAKEFSQFVFVSVIGLVINTGIASLIVNVVGPQAGIEPEVWANVGKLIGIMFSLVWNFVGYKFWVFK